MGAKGFYNKTYIGGHKRPASSAEKRKLSADSVRTKSVGSLSIKPKRR